MTPRRTVLLMVLLAALCAVGFGASHLLARHMEREAERTWLNTARVESGRLSDIVAMGLSKLETAMRATTGRFRLDPAMDAAAFDDLYRQSGTWDADVSFDNLAFVEPVARGTRAAFEARAGAPITVAGDSARPAPHDIDHLAVRVKVFDDGVIRVNAALDTHPALAAALTTAMRIPGEVVPGPSYVGPDGVRRIPIAMALGGAGTNAPWGGGILLATVNIRSFIDTLLTSHVPPGLMLRLGERDTDTASGARLTSMIGALAAPAEAVATTTVRLTRGEARWTLSWDVLADYQNGRLVASARLVWFAGLAATLAIAGIIGFLALQNARFYRLVEDRTAELSQHAMIIQLTMDSIDQGFVVWNSDHRLVVWSRQCLDFWYHPDDIVHVGMHMRDLLRHIAAHGAFGDGDADGLAEREYRRITALGEGSEETFTMDDGRIVYVHRFPLDKGGYVAVYHDITRQHEAETAIRAFNAKLESEIAARTEDLRQATEDAVRANQSKSDFLANMSHELRTPLNAILGFSQMLQSEIFGTLGSDKNKEYCDNILAAGHHLHRILGDILDLSRIEAGDVSLAEEDMALADVVEECVVMLTDRAAANALSLYVNLPTGLPRIRADRLKVKQILLNLLTNAIKFTPRGGTVNVGARSSGGGIAFWVSDTGIGIPSTEISRVLEPFCQGGDAYTRQQDGTGLGLALVKRLTELHGGTVSIESVPNQGATVTIAMPAERVVTP
ncbi:MAG: PAS-domain containing protein [Alphaproteobacteria bacterium]|nr:PAS-domain containing protein [Alphaproteobacteria bacterium]MBF0250311.1 PAS-domain containing protein [Alphaproteobacteria bacterium]